MGGYSRRSIYRRYYVWWQILRTGAKGKRRAIWSSVCHRIWNWAACIWKVYRRFMELIGRNICSSQRPSAMQDAGYGCVARYLSRRSHKKQCWCSACSMYPNQPGINSFQWSWECIGKRFPSNIVRFNIYISCNYNYIFYSYTAFKAGRNLTNSLYIIGTNSNKLVTKAQKTA